MVQDAVVPAVLAEALTASVADELAAVFDDQVVFPHRIVVDDPRDAQRLFPSWPTPVLVVSHENQGVVSWGVPLGDPSPPVVVGGELDDTGADSSGTVVYARSVEAFIAARRWDQTCWSREPLVQAQAEMLDDDSLAVLRARFEQAPATWGWPGHTQYRFEGRGVRLMLWSGSQQCDWWLSGTDTDTLAEVITDLMDLSTCARRSGRTTSPVMPCSEKSGAASKPTNHAGADRKRPRRSNKAGKRRRVSSS